MHTNNFKMNRPPAKEDIIAAHTRIGPYIHRTPVQTCDSLDDLTGCALFFKCENFQKVGAFKARGAMNAALSLPESLRANGIATHSSGNHGQAVARAAKLLNIKSFIVMPSSAAEIKKQGVRLYGGEIIECEPTQVARERTLAAMIMKTKAAEIHPFNNYDVIAGQATAAKELLESIPHLESIITPVGGGGLLSGTALAVKYFSPYTEVFAAEPDGADDAYRAMKSGRIEQSQSDSIADGLLTSLGSKTFPIIRENVKEVLTVSDRQIVEAMKLIWDRMKIIVEPSCAVPLAAMLKYPEKFNGKRVGVILTGGNVDLPKAFDLFSKYLS
jgi:threonine dehydratase